MKRKNYILILLSFGLTIFFARGQQIANYVGNGSFESLSSSSLTTYYNCIPYWQPIDTGQWSTYLVTKRPPIANAPWALGYQYPRTGDNYVVSTFFCSTCQFSPRGYLRNRLKTFLQPNKTYCVKYHIVNTNNTPLAISNYGVHFANTSLDTITNCTNPLTFLIPQITNPMGVITDTMNWVAMTGTFVANGSEKYMVIGNFNSDATTNTLLINPTYSWSSSHDVCIDDVSVIDIDLPAFAGPGPNTWCIPGDSVFIGRQPDVGIDEACIWYKLPNTTTAIDTVAGLWVKPVTTTTYIVKQEICGNIKYDTIVVHQSATGLKDLQIYEDNVNISPNPTSDNLNISFPQNTSQIFVTNSLGQIVRRQDVELLSIKIILQTSDLSNGLYHIHFKTSFGMVTKKFVKTD